MTTLATTVQNDPNFILCLDHGFIGLVDAMPAEKGKGDDAIVRAARVSYGAGTSSINTDRGLIRYLMRHMHTTPFEMVEFKFHVKLPLFVARQWVRHRTANINEYSGRYSIMSSEFYIPKLVHIKPQSNSNHQGRAGEMSEHDAGWVQWIMQSSADLQYKLYEVLLNQVERDDPDVPYDLFAEDALSKGFTGIARELARMILPVNVYTEWYWKCDLNNILRFISLRMDDHAQYEIQVYAKAMYDLIKPYAPFACEAFEDYVLNGAKLSSMERDVLIALLSDVTPEKLTEATSNTKLSKREVIEFQNKFNLSM